MNKGRVEHRGTPTPDLSRFDGPSGTPPKAQEENQDFGPEEKVSEMDPMPGPAAKERAKLDNLFMLGYLEEEVEIGGYVFKFKTLSNAENEAVATFLGRGQGGTEDLFITQNVILAHTIISVNGSPLEELSDIEGTLIEQRVNVLKRLQTQVVTKLMNFYSELTQQVKEGISEEDLKK